MIGDPEPLTHEERLDFDAEEARLEIEDRRRGRDAALAWLEVNGTPEVLERIHSQEFPYRILPEIEPPAGFDWGENDYFTREFLATMTRVAGQRHLQGF